MFQTQKGKHITLKLWNQEGKLWSSLTSEAVKQYQSFDSKMNGLPYNLRKNLRNVVYHEGRAVEEDFYKAKPSLMLDVSYQALVYQKP